jgi:hypothetical protein
MNGAGEARRGALRAVECQAALEANRIWRKIINSTKNIKLFNFTDHFQVDRWAYLLRIHVVCSPRAPLWIVYPYGSFARSLS